MKANSKQPKDLELLALEEALLRSIDQAQRSEGTIHTPDEINARRGRPAGRMVSHKVVYEDCAGTGVKEGCLKGAAIVILKVNLGLRRLNSTNRKPQ
jgi:hypothetical protein